MKHVLSFIFVGFCFLLVLRVKKSYICDSATPEPL